MQKKIDISTHGDHLIQVAIQRPDEHSAWALTVLVRPSAATAWSDPWVDTQRTYFTCFDALAAGKQQGARMIEARRAATVPGDDETP